MVSRFAFRIAAMLERLRCAIALTVSPLRTVYRETRIEAAAELARLTWVLTTLVGSDRCCPT